MGGESCGRCALLLTLCILLGLVSESHPRVTSLVDVPVTSEEQCRRTEEMVYVIQSQNRYSVRINFDRRKLGCPLDKKGFQCGVFLSVPDPDPFETVGDKLCIDLAGVAETIPHNQFAIIISASTGDVTRVYSKSTRFDRPSYNVQCSLVGATYIHILLRAIETVKMCPYILPTLANHNTSLGTVYVKNVIPTHTLKINQCSQNHRERFEEHSILKVIPGGSYRYGCALSLRPQVQYRQIQTCISVAYVSDDFRCGVEVTVKKGMVKSLSFKIPLRKDWNPSGPSRCFKFNWLEEPDNSFPNLVITSNIWSCEGRFALELKYSRAVDSDSSGYGPKSSINRRNLYMAVFISVISVCIFIMGLTCLCCLRMRARNRQRSQASGRRATSNTGYEGNPGHGDSPAFWTSTSSDQVFGLPSYEEATLDSIPSSPDEAEKPPAYETLYTNENSLPSTSVLTPLEESGDQAQFQRETPSAPES